MGKGQKLCQERLRQVQKSLTCTTNFIFSFLHADRRTPRDKNTGKGSKVTALGGKSMKTASVLGLLSKQQHLQQLRALITDVTTSPAKSNHNRPFGIVQPRADVCPHPR